MAIGLTEAYNMVEKLPGRNVLLYCGECEDEWEFSFAQNKLLYTDDWIEGGCLDVVNKKTGAYKMIGSDPESIFPRLGKPSKELDATQFPKGKDRYVCNHKRPADFFKPA